jgi:MFS family permease
MTQTLGSRQATRDIIPAETDKNRLQKWHALAATFMGEAFDAMDATIYFIALFPALSELLQSKDSTTIGYFGSAILAAFMVGWALGSILFGMVADHFGRVKTMMWTILLYAAATALCAFTQTWWEMALCRFAVGLGIGGEISVGCVLLGEAWSSNRRKRLWAMSVMQCSFGMGSMMTGLINLGSGQFGWRYLFLAGIVPALITLYIRAKLTEPESVSKMLKARKTGQFEAIEKNPLKLAFNKENRTDTLVCSIMASSAIVGYWAGISWIPAWINQLTGAEAVEERSAAMMCLSVGGILGCLIVPWLVEKLGYRKTFLASYAGCLLSTLGMFLTIGRYSEIINLWTFIVGIIIVVPFTVLTLYICDCFATHVLGTASGIAWGAGRIFAALAGICTGPIIAAFGGSYGMAAATVELVYLVGFVAAFWVKEYGLQDSSINDESKLSCPA